MNRKGISILVIVVIVVAVLVVVGVVAYWAISSGGEGDGGGNGGGNNGGDDAGAAVDVSEASSLRFSVEVTSAGMDPEEYTYMIKNAGTSSLMMRIEMVSPSNENWIYIINGVQQKVWVHSEGEWMDFSDLYPSYWNTWNSAWEGYRTSLLGWNGVGDWSYTTPNGDSVRIYEITVNPSLADSLFEHS